jgi:phosphohistidine phosphatase SixA
VRARILPLAALALLAAGCCAPAADLARPAPASAAGETDAAARIDAVLDALHRAAATADEATYFSLFASEAVFLGTDATERWTLEEFRAFALPYFARESAWTYRPRDRRVSLLPGGDAAFFDELLDHDRYGECRGTGVLRRDGDAWRIAQYHLTFPIPNEIADAVTRAIREGGAGARWVFVVRHAEKEPDARDPDLTAVGRARAERLAHILAEAPLAACIATEYRRTQRTVEPAAGAAGLEVETIAAGDLAALVARLDALPAGRAALVAGHSNTVPALLRSLGVAEECPIGDDDYGQLFAVRRGAPAAELLRLRF